MTADWNTKRDSPALGHQLGSSTCRTWTAVHGIDFFGFKASTLGPTRGCFWVVFDYFPPKHTPLWLRFSRLQKLKPAQIRFMTRYRLAIFVLLEGTQTPFRPPPPPLQPLSSAPLVGQWLRCLSSNILEGLRSYRFIGEKIWGLLSSPKTSLI